MAGASRSDTLFDDYTWLVQARKYGRLMRVYRVWVAREYRDQLERETFRSDIREICWMLPL